MPQAGGSPLSHAERGFFMPRQDRIQSVATPAAGITPWRFASRYRKARFARGIE